MVSSMIYDGGQVSKSFSVEILDDSTAERDEFFTLTLLARTAVTEIIFASVNVSIIDDDGK